MPDIGRDIATLCDPTNLFSWLLDKGATVVKSAEFHESLPQRKIKQNRQLLRHVSNLSTLLLVLFGICAIISKYLRSKVSS